MKIAMNIIITLFILALMVGTSLHLFKDIPSDTPDLIAGLLIWCFFCVLVGFLITCLWYFNSNKYE